MALPVIFKGNMNCYSIYKMVASFCMIHLLGTFCFLRVSALPSVTASFYENPINEDLEAMLHCAVLLPPSEFVIDILKGSNFLVRQDEVLPQNGMDMSLSSDGNTLILKIASIHRDNSGTYTCRVLVPEFGGAWRTVSSDQTSLDVRYFSQPPRCLLTSGVVLAHGDGIGATCTATPGNPAISIQWTKVLANGVKAPITADYGMTSITVTAQLETVFNRNEDNVIFTCTITSPAFPDAKDNTCTVGPLRLKPTPLPPPHAPNTEGGNTIPTSDGPEVRVGANPEVGTPAIITIVVVLLIVALGTFIFLLMRFRRVTSEKQIPRDAEGGMPGRETAIPPYKPKQSVKPVKSQKHSKNKSFTVIAEVLPMRKGKHYPPPPAYPTADQQQQLNLKYLNNEKNGDVMSVTSWGDILDSGQPNGNNSGDQFASDGDGLVVTKRETKTDSLKRMFGASTGNDKNIYSNEIIMYADVKKPKSPRGRGSSVISQHSVNSNSPLYACIN